MNAHVFRKMIALSSIFCLALAGCQVEKVILEKEMDCTIIPLDVVDGIYLEDLELGEMERAEYNQMKIDCPETYLDGTIFSLSDAEMHEDGSYYITGWNEIVTKERGAWKGMCELELTADKNLTTCSFTGDGKYKGLTSEVSLKNEAEIFKTTIRIANTGKK